MNLLFAEEIKQTEKRKSLPFDHLSSCLDKAGIVAIILRANKSATQDCWHSWSSDRISKGLLLQLEIPQSLQCSASALDRPGRGAGKSQLHQVMWGSFPVPGAGWKPLLWRHWSHFYKNDTSVRGSTGKELIWITAN